MTTTVPDDPFEKAVFLFKYWFSRREYPNVFLAEDSQSLRITPLTPDGYEVTLARDGSDLIVYTEQWHCHEDDPVAAASLTFWLLTPFMRIVYELSGGEPWACWLEAYMAEGWQTSNVVYFKNPMLEESWEPEDGVFERHFRQQFVLEWGKPIEYSRPGCVLDGSGLPLDSHLGHRIEKDTASNAPRPIA